MKDNEKQQATLMKCLKKEWLIKRSLFKPNDVISLYFGGGTPSRSIAIIKEVLLWFETLPIEITVESNPEDLTREKLQDLQIIGVNRLSIGAQSFIDSELQTLGRAHTSQKAIIAIQMAAQYISNLSIDLMMELPDQTFESFQKSCEIATSLPICHLSLYNLTIEPKTAFARRKDLLPRLPKEGDSLKMLQSAIKIFEKNNLHRYEISAFCKKGFESKHNLGYWQARPFLGFGPSAFSYWNKSRFQNSCNLVKYAKALESEKTCLEYSETLSFDAHFAELFAVELRVLRGIDLDHFQKRHGTFSLIFSKKIDNLLKQNLLIQSKNHVRLSERGKLFYDTVAEYLI